MKNLRLLFLASLCTLMLCCFAGCSKTNLPSDTGAGTETTTVRDTTGESSEGILSTEFASDSATESGTSSENSMSTEESSR